MVLGCAAVAGLLLIVAGCGIGAFFYFGGAAHYAGYATHARYGVSPLVAYQSQRRHLEGGDYAAAYYYYDEDSRQFLDQLAREHGLRDGIELLAEFYAPTPEPNGDLPSGARGVQLSLERNLESRKTAAQMFRFSEEVDGDSGAVLIGMPGDGKTADRITMVRVSGVWHHPMTEEERSEMERRAKNRFRSNS